MGQERHHITRSELARWAVAAALLLVGIAAYFRLAPTTAPVAPAAQETAP
jgi:hypothetical protein